MDVTLLKSSSVEIREIGTGYIYCSLSGDFVSAPKDLLKRYQPDRIIIKPSEVDKLSDIITTCADPQIQSLMRIKSRIIVTNVERCKMYLENSDKFFIDQIENADVVLLSRVGFSPDRAVPARKLVKKLNPHIHLFSEPWEQIAADEILAPHPREAHCGHDRHCSHSHEYSHAEAVCFKHSKHAKPIYCDHYSHDHRSHAELACSDHHDHHDHHSHRKYHGACKYGHNHTAEEVFDTVTARTKQRLCAEDLLFLASHMRQSIKGPTLRAKGIVQGTGGYPGFQYLPGDVQITNSVVGNDMFCFIDRHLNQQELTALSDTE